MRQRVAIAVALLNRPKLIVCDEPTTALDVSIQAQILTEMRSLVAELGTALIWISHDLATVSSLAGRILVMYAGRVVEQGPTAHVLAAPRHPYTRGLLRSLPAHGEPGHDLAQMPGSTPSLLDLPDGCAFRPRCAEAGEACGAAPPETIGTGGRPQLALPLPAETEVGMSALFQAIDVVAPFQAAPDPRRADRRPARKHVETRSLRAVATCRCRSRAARCWAWWANPAAASPRWPA